MLLPTFGSHSDYNSGTYLIKTLIEIETLIELQAHRDAHIQNIHGQ